MRETLIKTGLFAGVVIAALAAIVLLNEPKGFGGGGDDRSASVTLSGERATLAPQLAPFTAVTLSVPASIHVTVGADQRVEVEGDRAVLDRIEIAVDDGALEIRPKDHLRIRKNHDLKVAISVPALSAFTVNGAAEGKILGLTDGDFALLVNGAADLDLEGACDSFSLTINGAGDVDASGLRCRQATATINGAGNAEVYAQEKVAASINGAGNIRIHGQPPQVQAGKIGFGHIEIVKDEAKTEG